MAVTVIYSVPGLPGFGTSTTPPTLAQMAALDAVVATVIFAADADTLGTITHNMAIPAASLNLGVPFVSVYPQLLGTGPTPLLGSLLNSNTVLMSKSSVTYAGTNGTYQVTILRPNTLML